MDTVSATELQPVKRRVRTKTTRATGRKSRSDRTRLITLDHIDRRTLACRRALELIEALENERGGPDQITEGQRQLCQRAGVLAAILEDHESRWIDGKPIDMPEYLSAIGTQRRVLISLGLNRVPRDVSPVSTLSEYLTEKQEDAGDAD
jgi:hypothetical protein